jgi:hypothetical protein
VTITRIGSNPKYAAAWDRAFGKKKAATSAKKTAASTPAKKKKKAKQK